DDGAIGMSAIKRSGGFCIVQDPDEAKFPSMPLAVLNYVNVDYSLPIAEIGNAVREIIARKQIPDIKIPDDIVVEAALDRRVSTGLRKMSSFNKSPYSCPDCGGGLWEVGNDES